MCALVSSKAAAEAYHECLRVYLLQDADHLCGVSLVAEPLLSELITYVFDKFLLQCHARLPYLIVRHIIYSMPNFLVALVLHKGRVEVLVVYVTPFRSRPCGEVHAIGDVTHVVFFGIISFPQRSEHLLAHPSVQFAHAIDFLASVASKGTHAEALAVVVGIGAAHADKLIPCNSQALRIATHILAKELLVKVVVAGRHRCMNGVERACAHQLHSLIEAQAAVYIVAKTLQVAQCGMAFVAVIDVFLDAKFL